MAAKPATIKKKMDINKWEMVHFLAKTSIIPEVGKSWP